MSSLKMEPTKCPSCGRDIYTAVCPHCGRVSASEDALDELGDPKEAKNVREFSILWYRYRMNYGDDDRFVEAGWRVAGMSEVTTCSRGTWLFLNFAVIVMLFIILFLFSVLELRNPNPDVELILLLTCIFTAVYSAIFYFLTYVPPKS